MSFFPILTRLNGLLYRRDLARLSPRDRTLARTWMIQFMKANHPEWDSQRIDQEYKRLLDCRPMAIDEWERRMRG